MLSHTTQLLHNGSLKSLQKHVWKMPYNHSQTKMKIPSQSNWRTRIIYYIASQLAAHIYYIAFHQSAIYCAEQLLRSRAVIDARQKMKTFCTRYGAAKSWTECGERIRHGIFGTRGCFPVSASCLPGFLITKGTLSYLLSPFGPFGTKETR